MLMLLGCCCWLPFSELETWSHHHRTSSVWWITLQADQAGVSCDVTSRFVRQIQRHGWGWGVALCCCCAVQVCGACVYVALVSRLLLPWYTADYALEQLADALEQSALLFGRIYASQLERMRLAELVAGQIKQGGPEALQVHVDAAPPPTATAPAGAKEAAGSMQSGANGAAIPAPDKQQPPAVALAACEAAEAKLLVVLRQQVLSRLVAVQLSLAKESVSWRRGVLATPPLVLNVLGAMNAVKEALTSQRLALAPFTKHGTASMTEQPMPGGAGAGSGMLHTMEHCYTMWALPLHPLWLEVGCGACAVCSEFASIARIKSAIARHALEQPFGLLTMTLFSTLSSFNAPCRCSVR
jgi:hypothetical protein